MGSPRSWQAAGVIVSILVLGVCVPGCGFGKEDEDLVASEVETLEGAGVEATSCKEVGEAIIRDSEYGAQLSEAWKCAVDRLGGSGPVESCYTVYTDLSVGVYGRLDCSSLGRGCPPGGRRVGDAVSLGPIIHPDLVLERARGNAAPHRTVRVDVSQDANGAQQHCGYLDVQLPIDVEAPLKLAAERAEAHGWSEDRYSLTSRTLDG